MADHAGGHGGHGPAFPRTTMHASWWPLVVGVAVAILGLSLFWASSEDNEDVTVPVVGAAAALLVVTAVGWAVEEGAFARRMRGERLAGHLAVRNTQVVTFAVPEGQVDAARAEGGILRTLEGAESALRSHPGFEDLRVTVAGATVGPSQALVETTWASREALAGYDAGKETILDLLATAGDQVVAGSVQAFDMEVVRDSKESPIRFTLLHAAIALVALVVGGFAVGIVAGAVQEEGAVVADGGNGAVVDPYLVAATDNKFDKSTLVAPPNTEVTFTLTNKGKVPHNLSFYQAKDGPEIVLGEIATAGMTVTVTFTTPGVGEYYFQCDLHPTEMFGKLEVKEGAPKPGEDAGGGGGVTEGPITLNATDNKFDQTTMQVAAGSEVEITLNNKGKVQHNLAILTKENGDPLVTGAKTQILSAAQSETIKFTAPAAGTYFFVCELHPTEMKGQFIVK